MVNLGVGFAFGGKAMPRDGETLVSRFMSLGAVGPLRRRWLSSAEPLIARAQREFAYGERCLCVAIGENRESVLEGVVLTDRRIGVIGLTDVDWFAREDVWELSSLATSTVRGEVLSVYGSAWDLAWSQMRPLGAAYEMGSSLRQELQQRSRVHDHLGR